MKNKKNLIKKYGLNKPFNSLKKEKKKTVFVKNPKTGNIITVHFGQKGYSDFTQHKDKKRRASFRARHKCNKKDDKTKPGYWACKELW